MTEPIRISADAARTMVIAGEALLVCAYEDAEKFRHAQLQDAISFQDLHRFKLHGGV